MPSCQLRASGNRRPFMRVLSFEALSDFFGTLQCEIRFGEHDLAG